MIKRIPFCFGLALVALGSPAQAVEPSLKQAQALFDALDYPGAAEAARGALARGGHGPAEVRVLLELLGSTLAIVNQDAEAGQQFRRLLVLDPAHKLTGASPKILAPFARAQAEARGTAPLATDHRPPPGANCNRPLSLRVGVANDPLRMVRTVRVVYQLPGDPSEASVEGGASVGSVILTLPALQAPPGQLGYRVELVDRDGNVLVRSPFVVSLERAGAPAKTAWYRRWWVWTLVGVAVAGATAGAVLGTRGRGEEVSDLQLSWSTRPLR